ncbi:unnamed protein product [Paramecium octaurelia]|uniref:Transmembrane protein n=1 Tax=Paramecium octaurelia TaxID=43137 RepID=A0A8S1SB18_PAROT|nr:unnamed protein product [Paramecium octaurelia]
MNQENAKLKKTKDSILIKKNGKYSEEVRELARKRAIYILVIECGILITYLIFLIAYSIQDKFKLLFLIIQIGLVFFQILSIYFSVHSLIFFKEYIISKSSNMIVLLYCLMIAPLVLMYLEVEQFILPIILQIIFLLVNIILCILDQYLIRKFVIDFLKSKQRYNLQAALHNQKSFDDYLIKSIMSKSEENP